MEQTISPTDAARQTLISLSKRSLPPTPENYSTAYNEIIGVKASDVPSVSLTLKKVLLDASKNSPKYIAVEKAIASAIKKKNWENLEAQFHKLLPSGNGLATGEANWSLLIRTLLKQLETSHKGMTLSRKKEGLSRVLTNFAKDPIMLAEKIRSLIRAWGHETAVVEIHGSQPSTSANLTSSHTIPSAAMVTESKQEDSSVAAPQWQEMLLKTLDLVLIPQLENIPDAHKKAQALFTRMHEKSSGQALVKHAKDLKNILLTLEIQRDSQHNVNEALLNLLRLMTHSMEELTAGDEWTKGQIGIVSDIVSKPVDVNTLHDAESSLKELIHKQSNLKPAVQEAKNLLKQMTETFISRLVEVTESTGDYQHKIETHQEKLSNIDGIDELNSVLKNVLDDTRSIGLTVQRTREEFQESQKKVTEAEQKIYDLTAVLDHIGTVANEDYLTGTLNRRGMDEALEREFDRADRHNTELSIAMMDIDHFKKLNDSLGHTTGDEALVHLTQVIKKVKRTTDVLARYGGEEFIIILPTTAQDDGIKVIERVQRELTKDFFMHSDERVVITFSAGVAQRKPGETADSIVPRADAALYKAKEAGRNRVLGAE